jgi:nitrogen-specific signal transduction histidine kinase
MCAERALITTAVDSYPQPYWLIDSPAVEIAVDGPGIPDEVLFKTLGSFFTTKAVGEGAGLGLGVARRIVTARCRGEFGFESKDGETAFQVRLPLG